MKKSHIVVLIGIAIAIGALIMISVDFSTYDTIVSAKKKQGKFVHLIARLDKSVPLDYDPAKNPNYLSFTAIDSMTIFQKAGLSNIWVFKLHELVL